MEIVIQLQAPELSAAILALAEAIRNQPATTAPPEPRKRRTKAEMEADAKAEMEAAQATTEAAQLPLPPAVIDFPATVVAAQEPAKVVMGSENVATPAKTEVPAPKAYSMLDVRDALKSVQADKGADFAVAILNRFGASKISGINPGYYARVISACKEV